MAQDLRKILAVPLIFDLYRKAVTRKDAYEIFISRYVEPKDGMAVLDIGCGTGLILEHLPKNVAYKGYDISAEYIESARKNYGDKASFAVGDAASLDEPDGSFDIAITVGVLHHLDDATVSGLLAKVARILKPGGRFVSIDGVYIDKQSWVARRLLDSDRGEHVRKEEHYLRLAKPHFARLDHAILHDMLRIPYTHIVMIGRV